MTRFLLLLAILLSSTATAADPDPPVIVVTGARDAEWAGYRHAYKAAAMFARMTATRPLIQAHTRPASKCSARSARPAACFA